MFLLQSLPGLFEKCKSAVNLPESFCTCHTHLVMHSAELINAHSVVMIQTPVMHPAGLTENRCLSKKPTGATLLQVGEQDVAFGAKFRARVVLNIEEHSEGTPQRLCRNDTGSSSTSADERLFPMPRSPPCDGPCRDVCFSLVEGDFQVPCGIFAILFG